MQIQIELSVISVVRRTEVESELEKERLLHCHCRTHCHGPPPQRRHQSSWDRIWSLACCSRRYWSPYMYNIAEPHLRRIEKKNTAIAHANTHTKVAAC